MPVYKKGLSRAWPSSKQRALGGAQALACYRPAISRRFLLRTILLLLGCTGCSLIATSISASYSTAAETLQHIQATYKGRANSLYNVAGQYYHLEVNYSTPIPPLLARAKYAIVNSSCWEIAKAHEEPFTDMYMPTEQAPMALAGNVPRAIWQWSGPISRKLFDSVPFILRESPVAEGCPHCTFVLRYKVLDGLLYTDRTRRHRVLDGQEEEVDIIEELLLAALHMYKVPDVDFLLHLGDGCPAGLPLVQVNINRSNPQAGFTLPKFMWRDALGPQQFRVLSECLQVRYPQLPQQQRIRKAVWRGSNTDSGVALMDERNVLDVLRTRLHLFGRWYPEIIDAHYTSFAQQAFDTNCVEELLQPGDQLPLEQFNRYSLLLDIDGNGWSDRYRLLSHFNTPVLKQASNLTAFFEHIVVPGLVVEQYNHDLSDLPVRVAALLQELQQQPARLLRMAERQQGLAHFLLNQVSLMHATAFTMTTVAQLSNWKPVLQATYEVVPFNKCCSYAKHLPAAFIDAVKARGQLSV